MSKSEPTIQKFMATTPFFIESDKTIKDASDLMSQKKIRHLPVMRSGEVVGIISDRDVKLACGMTGADPKTLPVSSVCHEHPYMVSPDALLGEVSTMMAQKHYGSAIVVQNGKLVGIFTTVDACRALAEVLQTRFHAH